MSQAASAGAYQMRHAVREAAGIVLRHGVWPAACELAQVSDRSFKEQRLKWQDGQLLIDSKHKLAWTDILKNLFQKKLISGAMVHTYYRSQWAKADFRIAPQAETLPIDALALRSGKQANYTLMDRERVQLPPFQNTLLGVDMFTPYGLITLVSVNKETGEVKLEQAEGFIDVGKMGQYDIVEGQVTGALAMGLGETLYEELPLTKGGPGEGGWNFGRYRVPTMRDMPINRFKLTVIEPISGDPPKGMAEVVECAVPPSIANAIAHATGKRFRDLPISPDKIKGAFA
jgi:CO/xanthine dehydrogenase Mo-binding subunit